MKEILLSKGKVAIVDNECYSELSKYKWYAANKGKLWYAARRPRDSSGNWKTIYMHTEIMSTPSGFEIDHINGDGLDNRKENLRVVTHRENQQNMHMLKTSKHPGVNWDIKNRKWRATIYIGDKNKHLGLFTLEEDASVAYQNAIKSIPVSGLYCPEEIDTGDR
jgi:hypothetical protein